MTLRTRDKRLLGTLAGAALAVTAALVIAGCGSSTASSPAPSPTPSQSSIAARVMALKDYLGQVKPITDQLGSTVASLPGDVKGMGAKPGAGWTAAASALDASAAQLGSEADSLSALTPPASLQSTQDAAVKAIQSVQSGVTDTANFLNKKVAKAGTTKATIKAQLSAAQAKVSGAGQQLLSAIQGLIVSPDSTPTP